jgi:hypothetical protein
MLALGELQKHAGPDTRVTAPAGIVDENSPPLVGVWRSWEGTDHETSGSFAGRPITPDYAAKKKAAASGGRFLTWLVSGAETTASPETPASVAHKVPTGESVPMLSDGTLANGDDRQVHLDPRSVGAGAYAWWVSGENQKARLPQPYRPQDEDSAAQWSLLAKSHAVADTKPFELDALLDDPTPAAKAITLGTADLFAKDGAATKPGEFFHDLSTTSVGLLTNTATGGWRKDLSLLSESWDRQPKSGLPFFQITPSTATQAAMPVRGTIEGAYPAVGMLYPWADYRPDHPNWKGPIYRQGAIASWQNLMDFATHYKRVTSTAGGRVTAPIHSRSYGDNSPNGHFDFIHRVRVLPVIARLQWVFSHSAKSIPGVPDRYEPRLLLTPVITMWNPYNVEITSPTRTEIRVERAMPAALKYTIDGVANPNYNSVMDGVSNRPPLGVRFLRYLIDTPYTLIPGETRVFSPLSTTPVENNTSVNLAPGYRPGGGHFYSLRGPNGEQPLSLASNASLKVEAKFDTTCNYILGTGEVGVAMYLDMHIPGQSPLVYRMVYEQEIANTLYPPIYDLANLAAGDLPSCESNPRPFLSTIFGARTASNTQLPAKGFVQSSPLVNHTSMGRQDELDPAIGRNYGGTAHPVNSAFDYSFVKHTPGGDSHLPNSDASNRGYIASGFTKADGLARCVVAELPVRPLTSLAELSHWDVRYENSLPPYALNIIANSDATPLLPSDKVVNSNDANLKVNFQHDDSYCANHLLFDDWFVSSIAPAPTTFGSSGRNQKETYAGFLTGETPLANRAYRPIQEDRAVAGQTDALYQQNIEPVAAWQRSASRLEVDGMFNVNSTSVTAWRALLGHARDQRVPHIRESGGGWNTGLADADNHVWSRFSIAGDTKAGTLGYSGAFPEATEFTGYRTVDDDFLDTLAQEVVVQIRKRGPFLSLSEFVNRQLSSGDLALAGTLQAAMNQLAGDPATDPFGELKALSTVATADPPNSPGNDEEYQFREAATGHSAYGMPGWIRQADILRPLAPILSARDDSFTIRTYGDARDKNGTILARAWCEATVRRTRSFVDPADAADLTTAPTRAVNQTFGRRFEVISFRWLAPGEI